MKYFKHEGRAEFFFSDGSKPVYNVIGQHIRLIALDETVAAQDTPDGQRLAKQISELELAAQRHIGGVVSIDATTFADLKKKLASLGWKPNSGPSTNNLRLYKPESANPLGTASNAQPAADQAASAAPPAEAPAVLVAKALAGSRREPVNPSGQPVPTPRKGKPPE
jgi:hypothetical protein